MERLKLKHYCLARLDEACREHPLGHQDLYAARYMLSRPAGEEVEIMFEKGPSSPANLWVEKRHVVPLLDQTGMVFRESPATSTFLDTGARSKHRYGRHSALKPMKNLKNADLVCFRIESPGDFDAILDHLMG